MFCLFCFNRCFVSVSFIALKHGVLFQVNEKPFEDLKHCMSSLTKGVVKFAQVVGVFPGPRFDDADGDAGEADVELLGWEESSISMA